MFRTQDESDRYRPSAQRNFMDDRITNFIVKLLEEIRKTASDQLEWHDAMMRENPNSTDPFGEGSIQSGMLGAWADNGLEDKGVFTTSQRSSSVGNELIRNSVMDHIKAAIFLHKKYNSISDIDTKGSKTEILAVIDKAISLVKNKTIV